MGHTGGRRRYGLKPVRNRCDDALARMDPLAFERLMGDYYRRQGYSVEDVGTGGRARLYDGGIDLKLYKEGEYTVVQCKRENAYQVTHNVVHELLGVMLTEGASRAVVVTTGEFTDAAWKKAANEGRLQLIDGTRLREVLGPLLPVEVVPPPKAPSLGASQGDLAAPRRERATPEWLPVGVSPAKRRQERGDASGFVVAVDVVLAMLLWQCSRTDTALSRTSRSAAQVKPDATGRPGVFTSPPLRQTATGPTPSGATGAPKFPPEKNGAVAPPAVQTRPASRPSGAHLSDEEAVKAYLETTPEM